MKKEPIILLCSILLIILWIYAGGIKLREHEVFIFSLKRQPIPDWSVPVVAIALPLAELVTAVLLGIGKYRSLGLLLSFILMASFTLYVALALTGVFGEIPCSCGGIISTLRWKGHLVFNLIFTIIAWVGWRLSKTGKTNIPDNSSGKVAKNQLI